MTRRWYGMVCLCVLPTHQGPAQLSAGHAPRVWYATSESPAPGPPGSGVKARLLRQGSMAAASAGPRLGGIQYGAYATAHGRVKSPLHFMRPKMPPGLKAGPRWGFPAATQGGQCGWVGGTSPCRARMRQNVKAVSNLQVGCTEARPRALGSALYRAMK
jgi:hypothetical protein